jgi:hypothetical protein
MCLDKKENPTKMKARIDSSYEKILPEDEAEKYRKHMISPNCLCGRHLTLDPIIYYTPHPDGYTVKGEPQKCWLYVKCPSCGYDMALWKMGVPRE